MPPGQWQSSGKKLGSNAIDVATAVINRVEQLKGITIPAGVEVTVTRNYGVTANDKAKKLIEKLLFATASVVILVLLAVGKREAAVVGAAVIVTLAATLFASWAWGFTINRVSLFALIFAIGILVDDAIVIVENVHRHLSLDKGALSDVIPIAVDEVGGPTILATFTVRQPLRAFRPCGLFKLLLLRGKGRKLRATLKGMRNQLIERFIGLRGRPARGLIEIGSAVQGLTHPTVVSGRR